MNLVTDRFVRQSELVPREKLKLLTVTVIGVGAIGRQVALQLAALGVRRLQLIDFDQVEPTNITTQGYLAADLGRHKVEATACAVQAIDASLEVEQVIDRFRPGLMTGEACLSVWIRSAVGPLSGGHYGISVRSGAMVGCGGRCCGS